MIYTYEPDRRRLHTLVTETATDRRIMDNIYQYDAVNNILNLTNNAPVSDSDELLGGPSEYTYSYDDLYRLTEASGMYTDSEDNHRYSLEMTYNNLHSITQKTQLRESKDHGDDEDEWETEPETTYDWIYEYEEAQPHAPVEIGNFTYLYDDNGNLVSRPERTFNDDDDDKRENLIWDEENRLMAITEADDDEAILYNIYDAGGERVLKTNNDNNVEISVNGTVVTQQEVDKLDDYIVYVNPYYVMRKDYFTTHFYVEGERVATKLSEEDKDLGLYFYHKDHLGSAAYTTGISTGETTQHIEYFPFGEAFVEEFEDGSDDDAGKDNPYRFNAKELDEETGLYYYGARYYDARTSVWQSVDPMAEKFPSWSPYNFVFNNPLNFTDPLGLSPESIHLDKYGNVLKNVDDGDNGVYVHQNATTEADVDKTYSAKNTSAGGDKIGEIGGTLNVDDIYANTLNKNIEESKDVYNPFTFKNYVKTNGKWDLKNNKNTIYGLANDSKTQFSFNGKLMESQDVGNHHFGAVALAYGLFPSEKFILKQAGAYQIKSGTSKPEWQIYKEVKMPNFTKTGRLYYTTKRVMQPPYGDDPRDQRWIKSGFQYFKNK